MRNAATLLFSIGLLVSIAPIVTAQTVYVTPNVATSPDGTTNYLPWHAASYSSGPTPGYALELTLTGRPSIDALHKLDSPDSWLFSVETPSDLGGALEVQPEDVVRYDAGALSLFFDGSCVSPAVEPGSNVSALTFTADGTALSAVFDVATDVGGSLALPSGLATYGRTGGGACNWASTGVTDLKALSSTWHPRSAQITALAWLNATKLLVSFDIAVDLAPSSGPLTYLPGQVAEYDTVSATWDLFEDLHAQGTPGWPVSSVVNALSCQANPGRIDPGSEPMTMGRIGSNVEIHCPGSCASGAESFGIYEGTLASLRLGSYDHVRLDCAANCPGSNGIPAGAGDRYYLAVPHNHKVEGGYGLTGDGSPRPQATDPADRCAVEQSLTQCP